MHSNAMAIIMVQLIPVIGTKGNNLVLLYWRLRDPRQGDAIMASKILEITPCKLNHI